MPFPNTFHQDKWKITFSNLPNSDGEKVDMRLFDLYVKTVVVPDMSFETINTDFKHSSIRQPASRDNDNLSQITIESI